MKAMVCCSASSLQHGLDCAPSQIKKYVGLQEEDEAAAGIAGYDFTGDKTPSFLFELPRYAVDVPVLEGQNVDALVEAAQQVERNWQPLLGQ